MDGGASLPGCHPNLRPWEVATVMDSYLSRNYWYLLRPSATSPGDVTICVTYDKRIMNFRIRRDPCGKYTLTNRKFDSIKELLRSYYHEPIVCSGTGEEIYLQYPISSADAVAEQQRRSERETAPSGSSVFEEWHPPRLGARRHTVAVSKPPPRQRQSATTSPAQDCNLSLGRMGPSRSEDSSINVPLMSPTNPVSPSAFPFRIPACSESQLLRNVLPQTPAPSQSLALPLSPPPSVQPPPLPSPQYPRLAPFVREPQPRSQPQPRADSDSDGEPTHMTWEEVRHMRLRRTLPAIPKPVAAARSPKAKSPKHRTMSAVNDSSEQAHGSSAKPGVDDCKVCMDATTNCVLVECGHMCCCLVCARKLTTCPVCRGKIVRVFQVFKS